MTLPPRYPSLAVAVLSAALSACSTTSYCKNPQPYENAPSIPAIKAPDGLSIATPSTALKVPDVKVDSVTFGYYAPDPDNPGEERIYCLDQPPQLVLAPEVKP
jgi:uncharacterized lipoprotein